jgi:hypothetical protein
MTNAEAVALIVTAAIFLIALGSWGLYWAKWRGSKLVTQVLFLVSGLCIAAGLLMFILLVLEWPSV